MNIRKPFDRQMFNETDAIARRTVGDYITSTSNLDVQDNEDIYGPDLVVYRGPIPICYAEVEMKRVWKAGQDVFPWPTINIPSRKLKYLAHGLPVEFWILREDLKMAMCIPGDLVESSPQVEVPNKYVPKGELFVQVPVEECILINMGK